MVSSPAEGVIPVFSDETVKRKMAVLMLQTDHQSETSLAKER